MLRFSSKPLNAARPFNHWDALKILALALMMVDHLGHFFFSDQEWLRAMGRSAPIIFLFLVGYAPHYRFQRELFLLALLLTASDFLLLMKPNELNILFNILICRAVLNWQERRNKRIERPLEWYLASMLLMLPTMFVVMYGTLLFPFALLGYMMRRREHYPAHELWMIGALAFAGYAAVQASLFDFSPAMVVLMLTVMATSMLLMLRLSQTMTQAIKLPSFFQIPALFAARYTGHLYVLHLIIMQWITYKQI
jgi:hypothetical protein